MKYTSLYGILIGTIILLSYFSSPNTPQTHGMGAAMVTLTQSESNYSAPKIVGGIPAVQAKLRYPKTTLTQGLEGTVTLEVVVKKDGSIGQVDVLTSPDDRLSRAALRAAKKVGYTPATLNETATKGTIKFPVSFAR